MALLSASGWIIPALLAAAVVSLCIIRDKRAGWFLAALIFVCLGEARGQKAAWDWQEREAAVERQAGILVKVSGVVSDLSSGGDKAEITLKKVRVFPANAVNTPENGETGTAFEEIPCLLVSVDIEETGGELHLGNNVTVLGEIQAFSQARNPGNFDYRQYYHAMGIDGRLFGESVEITDFGRFPLPDLLHQLRETGKRAIEASAEEMDAGIFCAAVLGDKKGLDSQVKDLYQRNGIAHLLAISGLHLSILGMGIYGLFRKAGAGYGWSGFLASCLIGCYGLLTGGSPSVARAVSMMMVSFLAAYLGRTYDLLSAASLALLFLAFRSPLLLFQGGVQLSFGAVFAIGGVSPVLEKLFSDSRLKALSVSLSIQLVTFPIVLYHFFQFPLYGMLLNLVVIPLMTVVVCSGIGTAVVGALSPMLGVLAAGPGHYVLRFYEWLLKLVSGLPHANIIMGRPGIPAIVAYYLLLMGALAFLSVWEARDNTAEGEPKGRPSKPFIGPVYSLSARCAILVLVCFAGFLILSPAPVLGLKAAFLDVGQGDGILLRTGKSVVLIDGGSTSDKSVGKNRLEPCLKSYGISRINYIFVSHGDRDHMSGVEYLLESCDDIGVDCLVLPYHGREDESLVKLKKLAGLRGIRTVYGKAGDTASAGNMRITCLYPGTGDIPSDTNEESLVLRTDYEDCHLLFTGDMSEAGETALLERQDIAGFGLENIQILKTAHHGSKYSSTEAFLDTVKPSWAVISYEEGNSYGHPHREVLERMEKRGITVFGTAEGGAVLLSADRGKIRWNTGLSTVLFR